MSALAYDTTLTIADAARIMRDATKDKSYRAYPLGGEAGHYLRWKRGRLTDDSYRDYESCLDKLARYFCDLGLADLEPPVGGERLEEFLDDLWGRREPRTYNKNLSILTDFFKWARLKGKLHGDPTLGIERHKQRQPLRERFTRDQQRAIIASQTELRDRIALRLLFHLGIRKGALQRIQFKHFDHQRRHLTIFTKGGKIRDMKIVDDAVWLDLERHILEWKARPDEYLLCRSDSHGRDIRDKPKGGHGLHNWWYRCLERAGIVAAGVKSGEKMHKTRYTAGQRILDQSGNLKEVQVFLGHAQISTTGDHYVDWEFDSVAETMRAIVRAEVEQETNDVR